MSAASVRPSRPAPKLRARSVSCARPTSFPGPTRSSSAPSRRSRILKVLVANLGSTSFKYRLFDLSDPAEPVLAQGAIERIGSTSAKVAIRSEKGKRELSRPIADHGEAVQLCLDQLTDRESGVLETAAEVAAIGFKAVHARGLTGV